MKKLFFRFNVHPGDFLRNTDIVELPDPDQEINNFLVYFMNHYQSDDRIAYIDDLTKVLNNEFFGDEDRNVMFLKVIGSKTKKEVCEEIAKIKDVLKNEAYKNFYNLIKFDKIKITTKNENE